MGEEASDEGAEISLGLRPVSEFGSGLGLVVKRGGDGVVGHCLLRVQRGLAGGNQQG